MKPVTVNVWTFIGRAGSRMPIKLTVACPPFTLMVKSLMTFSVGGWFSIIDRDRKCTGDDVCFATGVIDSDGDGRRSRGIGHRWKVNLPVVFALVN